MLGANTRVTSSSGQVLVMFAGGLVALLAIAALVIDLGFVFMVGRQAQNAADPGAIAAARYIRSGATPDIAGMNQAACFYARQNGFFAAATDNSGCVPANDGASATLTVNYPPSSSAGSFAGRPGFVEVVIGRPHQSFLAGIVGLGTIPVAKSAVAAFTDGDSNSNSIIALRNTGCGGNPAGSVSGGAQVTITPVYDPLTGLPYDGGYVHVNSTCGTPPSTNVNGVCGTGEGSGGLKIDGGASLSAPHVYVSGTCINNSTVPFTSPLTEGAVQIGDPLADLVPPSPGSLPAGQCGVGGPFTAPTGAGAGGCNFNSAGIVELQPGTYYGGWRIGNSVQLKLATGIYIIAGGGITLLAGGSIESVDAVGGGIAPVLIFSTDNPSASCPSGGSGCQDNLDFTATSTLRVRGIDSGPYKGILIWQDGNGSKPTSWVKIGGQSTLSIAGTIYAPKAQVVLTGGSSGTGIASVQIIAWEFDIGGGAALDMPYDPKELYSFEQKGLVR